MMARLLSRGTAKAARRIGSAVSRMTSSQPPVADPWGLPLHPLPARPQNKAVNPSSTPLRLIYYGTMQRLKHPGALGDLIQSEKRGAPFLDLRGVRLDGANSPGQRNQSISMRRRRDVTAAERDQQMTLNTNCPAQVRR